MPSYIRNQETYTQARIGATVGSIYINSFSIHVKGTDAAATAWDVRLYGSLDGENFTELLKHDAGVGDGIILSTGSVAQPMHYVRSRCVSLTLGSAANIVCEIFGNS